MANGFRRNFAYNSEWHGRRYAAKQVEAYAVEEDGWLVITVMVKYFTHTATKAPRLKATDTSGIGGI